ncbi:MAG: hypothetical protein ACKOD9_17090 [Rubrivivax sp.]
MVLVVAAAAGAGYIVTHNVGDVVIGCYALSVWSRPMGGSRCSRGSAGPRPAC